MGTREHMICKAAKKAHTGSFDSYGLLRLSRAPSTLTQVFFILPFAAAISILHGDVGT